MGNQISVLNKYADKSIMTLTYRNQTSQLSSIVSPIIIVNA